MQYFQPVGGFFVGDCMPFFHDGTFRLYYLLDEGHHQARGGLGGHQWAQASTRDLVHWDHHPLAIPLTEAHEGSICTGSVFFHEGVYHAFYATRRRDGTEHLSLAVSRDGVHFHKARPDLALAPAGYQPRHFRDPFVFRSAADGRFHMLVTACLADWPVAGRGGCLAHLTSDDLEQWRSVDPFIVPGLPGVPECPDYFAWGQWHYLLFSHGGVARYRMSRNPFGPWIRPVVDTLDGPAARVMKTAAFHGNRRLGVAWIGTRADDRDDGAFRFGGNAVFRELRQHEDGTLGLGFPAEMVPAGEPVASRELSPESDSASIQGPRIHLNPPQGLAVAACSCMPRDVRLDLRVRPFADCREFGLRLRAGDAFDTGCALRFLPSRRMVQLHDQVLCGVAGLDREFTVQIVLKGDIIDVCIAGRRTLIDRCPEQEGSVGFFWAQDSGVAFEIVGIAAL